MTTDPTIDALRAFVDNLPFASERTEFDREEAIYWFAYSWHGGQNSNLYSVLCQSEFSPGPCCSGPESGSMAELIVADLEEEFT